MKADFKPTTERQKQIRARWYSMHIRCTHNGHYVKKGITVSKEWNSFKAFLSWAEKNNFEPNLELDRIQTSGNYTPNNCRWVNKKTNLENRSTQLFLEYEYEYIKFVDLIKRFNLEKHQTAIRNRIFKYGWNISKALFTPIRYRALKTV